MAEAIHGKNVIIEMYITDTYYPILCGTDCTFSRTPEFIPITSTTSGLFREFMVRREEWVMSVSGLTKIANAATLTFFYMLQTSVRRTRQLVRITFTDSDGASKQITGNVLIGQMDINGPFSDFSQCTIELKGTGAYVIEDTEDPVATDYNYYSDYWQTVNGQNYISGNSSGTSNASPTPFTAFALLSTDVIIGVAVEGTGFEQVTGTPGNREYQFSTSPVRINFASDLIFDGTQRVFVMIKRAV